jgi:hypothetical protein
VSEVAEMLARERVVPGKDDAQREARIRFIAMAGLMHDAAEAYVGDIPRPIKKLSVAIHRAEKRLLEMIAEKYGLAGDNKNHDLTEGRALALINRDGSLPQEVILADNIVSQPRSGTFLWPSPHHGSPSPSH